MPTLLVNPKMDPMLAARIEASVSGRRSTRISVRSTARIVAVLRLGVIVGVLALVGSIALSRHQERVAFERNRAALVSDWRAQASQLSPKDREFLARIERLLADMAGAYPGDHVASALRADGALAAALARRAVYVRGPLEAFGSLGGVAKAASASGKDSLLLCLLDPPATSTEKAFLPKARSALSGGPAVQQLAPNVHRLHEIEFGLPYLLPPWGARVEAAKDAASLQRLERELRKAPISATRMALGAEVLIAVLDEPNDSGGVTELDGEHAHGIRVAVWDLSTDAPLIRLRRHVDPTWITANRRSQYARELDSCKLALEVHEAVRGSANR